MKCPYCGHLGDKVVDSRESKEGEVIRRRRECLDCGRRFTSYERIDEIPYMVIKKDGTRERFERQKLIGGLLKAVEKRPVTTETLFQAASISKPVAAMVAMRLVEMGRLSLDEDVNVKLRSWKVEENEFTAKERVTLRRLLSHTAGLTVHGFPGYAAGVPVPTLKQLLEGVKPANTAAIRPDIPPGSRWR